MPEDCYQGADILERAQEFAGLNGDGYLEKSQEERQKALVDFALPKNIAKMQSDLKKYRIEYDTWFHESVLHNDGEIQDTLKILTEKGMTYELDEPSGIRLPTLARKRMSSWSGRTAIPPISPRILPITEINSSGALTGASISGAPTITDTLPE